MALQRIRHNWPAEHTCKNTLSVQFNRSVMSDCLRPHGLQHAKLLCPSQMSDTERWDIITTDRIRQNEVIPVYESYEDQTKWSHSCLWILWGIHSGSDHLFFSRSGLGLTCWQKYQGQWNTVDKINFAFLILAASRIRLVSRSHTCTSSWVFSWTK